MKRAWEAPRIEVEEFVANAYCDSNCGKTVDGKYLFTCDAGDRDGGDVYLETNGQAGLQRTTLTSHWFDGDRELGGYHKCGTTHEASSMADFVDGYYYDNGKVTNVIVWRGDDGRNIHCTTQLNREHWTVERS